jgi:PAS domain S-box-containing protein
MAKDGVKAKQAQAKDHQQYHQILNALPHLVWTASPEGEVNFYNDCWHRYTGFRHHESANWSWEDAVHPDDLDNVKTRLKRSLESGESLYYENRYKKHDGTYRWHLNRAEPLRNDKGEITMWLASATDIHDRKVQMRFIETLTETSADSIIAVDTKLRTLVFNKKSEREYHKAKDEVIDKVLTDVVPYFKEQPSLWDGMQRSLNGENVHIGIVPGLDPDTFYEHFYIPLKDESEEVYAILHIDHDITQRIHSERALSNAVSRIRKDHTALQHAYEELSTFTKIASHDLKDPLRKIYNFIELIYSGEAQKLSNSSKSNFRRIQTAVQRMGLLTDDIAIFSGISAYQKELSLVNLHDEVVEVAEQLHDPIAQASALIIVDPMPFIVAYKDAVTLLLKQLLSNALKFQAPGATPRIHVSYALVPGTELTHPDMLPDAYYHRLTITDNGLGFDPAEGERIFGMFQRLHPDGQYKGSGMGLAIARKIVHMHDGYITAEGRPGQGATFTCYLQEMSKD